MLFTLAPLPCLSNRFQTSGRGVYLYIYTLCVCVCIYIYIYIYIFKYICILILYTLYPYLLFRAGNYFLVLVFAHFLYCTFVVSYALNVKRIL